MQELGAGVIPILETCEAGGLQLHLWQDPYHMPYAKLMAMLVLVAKVQMQQDKLIAPGQWEDSNLVICPCVTKIFWEARNRKAHFTSQVFRPHTGFFRHL